MSCVRGQGLIIFLIRSTTIFATCYVCNRLRHYTRFPGWERLKICITISAFKWLSHLSSLHNGRIFIPPISVAVVSMVNAFTFRCGSSACNAPPAITWLWITGAFATILTHNTSNWNSNERNVIVLNTANLISHAKYLENSIFKNRGIPHVKCHMETDGGKQLYNTGAGGWFKEL